MTDLAAVPPRLTHIALRASDLARSVAFYAKYAGLVVAHERDEDGTRVVWLAERAEDELPHPDQVHAEQPLRERAGCDCDHGDLEHRPAEALQHIEPGREIRAALPERRALAGVSAEDDANIVRLRPSSRDSQLNRHIRRSRSLGPS